MGEPFQFVNFIYIMSTKWLAWIGGLLMALGVIKQIMEKLKKDSPQFPQIIQKYLWGIVAICLILASYQGWLDENNKLRKVNIDLVRIQTENIEKDKLIQELKVNCMGREGKKNLLDMVGFYDEEIIISKDRAVSLNPATIRLMEASPEFYYSVDILVQDHSIAYSYTGTIPTNASKNILDVGSRLHLKAIANIKQFKAIGIGGDAILAVTYNRGK